MTYFCLSRVTLFKLWNFFSLQRIQRTSNTKIWILRYTQSWNFFLQYIKAPYQFFFNLYMVLHLSLHLLWKYLKLLLVSLEITKLMNFDIIRQKYYHSTFQGFFMIFQWKKKEAVLCVSFFVNLIIFSTYIIFSSKTFKICRVSWKKKKGLVINKNLFGKFNKEVRLSLLRNKNMLKCSRKYRLTNRFLVRKLFLLFFFHSAILFFFYYSRLVAGFSA